MTEKRKHTSKQNYYPIVLAKVLVFGMWLGRDTMPSGVGENGRRLLLYPQSGKLQSIINLIKEQYVDSIDVDKLEEKVIPEVLKNLDLHSVYIPPKDLQAANQELEGKFGGIGVEFSMQNDTVM